MPVQCSWHRRHQVLGVRCVNSKQPRRRNAQGSKMLYSTIHHSTQSSAGAHISLFSLHALVHKQISAYFQSITVYNSPPCVLLSITDCPAFSPSVTVLKFYINSSASKQFEVEPNATQATVVDARGVTSGTEPQEMAPE